MARDEVKKSDFNFFELMQEMFTPSVSYIFCI